MVIQKFELGDFEAHFLLILGDLAHQPQFCDFCCVVVYEFSLLGNEGDLSDCWKTPLDQFNSGMNGIVDGIIETAQHEGMAGIIEGITSRAGRVDINLENWVIS